MSTEPTPPGDGALLHVVGGGFNQIALIRKAKARGMRVLVTDRIDNPPGRGHADLFEVADTTDKERTLCHAERHGVDYVATDETDVAVPTVAYVAEHLGLPGIGYERALVFTHKHRMRSALEVAAGAYLPESHHFTSAERAVAFHRGCDPAVPYLVKPIDSQGSKGVRRLDGDFERQVAAAFDASPRGSVVVERFIDGPEYSVEAFVRDGKVNNLCVTTKYHYDENPCLDERCTFLGDVDPGVEQALFEANQKIITVLGLPFGSTHAEFKIAEGKVYLIEVAARGAGGGISSLIIPHLTGFEPLEALLASLANEPYDVEVRDYKQRCAVLRFFNWAPGTIRQIEIDDAVVSGLAGFRLDVASGDRLQPPRDSSDRPGYFIVTGTAVDEVLRRERLALSAVRIEYLDAAP